jgi:hypothetical protein
MLEQAALKLLLQQRQQGRRRGRQRHQLLLLLMQGRRQHLLLLLLGRLRQLQQPGAMLRRHSLHHFLGTLHQQLHRLGLLLLLLSPRWPLWIPWRLMTWRPLYGAAATTGCSL